MSNKKQEGYSSTFGVTKIIPDKRDNLSISWDVDGEDIDDKSIRIPVLLFTPDMDNTGDHYHIPLDYEQAVKLKKWLNEYVDDVYMYHEGKKNVEE